MYTLHTRLCTFGADSYARSVLINKISASELGRKFIKSSLLVGKAESAVRTRFICALGRSWVGLKSHTRILKRTGRGGGGGSKRETRTD